LPALKDPKSSDHDAALDYFGKSDIASYMRWILIRKYKLSTEDAIRFFGGNETDRFRRVMILYLQGNKEQMKSAFIDYISNTQNKGAGRVLASWAEGDLLSLKAEIEETDLKPPGAKSIEQAVREELKQY